MIEIKSNAHDLARSFGTLINGIPKANIAAIRKAQRKGVQLAQTMAPTGRTGDLKEGIYAGNIKVSSNAIKGQIISMAISKDIYNFPYNFWVNESPGFETINFFGSGIHLSYGATNNTGTPGYFTRTANILKVMFPKLVIKEHQRNLKKLRS